MGFLVLTTTGARKQGTTPSLDLAAATGTLAVANGGTGSTTLRTVFARKTGDESIANNTPQNDNDLLLAVLANEVWQFEIVLIVECAASTPDISVNFTIPAAGTLSTTLWAHAPSSSTVDGVKRIFSNQRVLTALSIGTIASGTTPTVPILITGLYVGGANAGTVQLVWSQTNTDAGNPVLVKADSYLKATRIA